MNPNILLYGQYTISVSHCIQIDSDNDSLYLLTYSMVQSPSWEANWFAAHFTVNKSVDFHCTKIES